MSSWHNSIKKNFTFVIRANQEPMGLLEHLELSDHLVRQGSLVPQVK